MNLPGVSIVMTPKDRTPLLMNTLETIWVQEYPDLEIIVVEDRPTESSLEFFCKRKGIKYAARRLKIEGWMNPAPLLNHGLLMATKDIVIFQNAEVKYETITGIADLVMPIVKAKIDQEPVLSTSAIVQCLSKTGEFEQWFVHPKSGARAGWVSPFCQAAPRSAWMKIQGFEEEFCAGSGGGYGYEDDLAEFLLRYSGVQIKCIEKTVVSHQWHVRYSGDQRNGNPDTYKRIRQEVENGVRPPIANWNLPWGNI